MYCVKCGVELSDTKKNCPLCGTLPYHPDISETGQLPTYPPFVKPQKKMNRSLAMLLITLLYAVVAAQIVLCDMVIPTKTSWSVYVVGGMVLLYLAAGLPLWFKKPNPVIFTPCFFVGAELFLLVINQMNDGDWFLSFAFPIVGLAGLIITAVVTLVRYVKKGYFYIVGGAVIALGAYIVLVELFTAVTFSLAEFHCWSIYPASGCLSVGMCLIVLGIYKPLRDWFAKKFFI